MYVAVMKYLQKSVVVCDCACALYTDPIIIGIEPVMITEKYIFLFLFIAYNIKRKLFINSYLGK